MVDRSAFDKIVRAGWFVSVSTGGAPDINVTAVPRVRANPTSEVATCIDWAVCVAASKNAAATLFTSAKPAYLRPRPQRPQERYTRTRPMVDQTNAEGFGSCTHTLDCDVACPNGISVEFVSGMNADHFRAVINVA